jgi:hypothetical protein
VNFDPATTGEAPISWGAGDPGVSGPGAAEGEVERLLGFEAAELGRAVWLPDDPDAIERAVAESGLPFNGAYVPLVVHDPLLAERSFDAAEWAADLIRGAGGRWMGLAPHAERGWLSAAPLSHRQWNHTAAMLERLDELCGRYRLQAVVRDTLGEEQARDDGTPAPDEPIHYVLDAGSFVPDGFVAARLVSPERPAVESNLTDRLRDFLRNRS